MTPSLSHVPLHASLRRAEAVMLKCRQPCPQVDELEGLEHCDQPRAKIGSVLDGTLITVRGHGSDLSPTWRHAGQRPCPAHTLTACCSLRALRAGHNAPRQLAQDNIARLPCCRAALCLLTESRQCAGHVKLSLPLDLGQLCAPSANAGLMLVMHGRRHGGVACQLHVRDPGRRRRAHDRLRRLRRVEPHALRGLRRHSALARPLCVQPLPAQQQRMSSEQPGGSLSEGHACCISHRALACPVCVQLP